MVFIKILLYAVIKQITEHMTDVIGLIPELGNILRWICIQILGPDSSLSYWFNICLANLWLIYRTLIQEQMLVSGLDMLSMISYLNDTIDPVRFYSNEHQG